MEKWVQRYEVRYAHDITQKANGTFVTYEAYERLQAKLEAADKKIEQHQNCIRELMKTSKPFTSGFTFALMHPLRKARAEAEEMLK